MLNDVYAALQWLQQTQRRKTYVISLIRFSSDLLF